MLRGELCRFSDSLCFILGHHRRSYQLTGLVGVKVSGSHN